MKKNLLYTALSAVLSISTLTLPGLSLAAPEVNNQEQPRMHNKEVVEVAFVLDTTGSMADLIEGAKKKIWSIANSIIDVNPQAEIRMALIAYRDKGDDYVIKTIHPLDTDVQALYSNLLNLRASGGGDTPESVNEALDRSVHGLQWDASTQTKRIIFLVGDAPPHMGYQDAPKYPSVIKQARKKDIIVNTVQAGNMRETRKYWTEMAKLGQGRYLTIPQDGGQISQIETPFDQEILHTQVELDKTVIAYGSAAMQADISSKIESRATAPAATRVDNSSFYAKKSGAKKVVTGGGDLLADINSGEAKLEQIKDAELPSELQNKTLEEKNAFIENKAAIRKQAEEKMADLVKKRDDYIAKNTNESKVPEDAFDAVVKSTLREQLK